MQYACPADQHRCDAVASAAPDPAAFESELLSGFVDEQRRIITAEKSVHTQSVDYFAVHHGFLYHWRNTRFL
jgi:hypothetical protein